MVTGPAVGGDCGLGAGGFGTPGRFPPPRRSSAVPGGVAGESDKSPKLGTTLEDGVLSIGDGGALDRLGPTVVKEKDSPSDLQLQEVEANGFQPEACMASPAQAQRRYWHFYL